MGGRNFIPRPDGPFDGYARNFCDAAKQWWVDHGFDETDLTPLVKARADWELAYPAHTAARAGAESAAQAKDAARREFETQMRPLAAFIQAFPETTDADRATIGITVRDMTPTPTSAPTSRPMVSVEPAGRLTHRLRLTDESTPTRTARPRGVLGAEVWLAVGAAGSPPPTAEAGYRFIALATRGMITTTFAAAEGGESAHYQLRWVSTRGERGPWSDVASATVAA